MLFFTYKAMHGATTTGAFDRDEPRGCGSAIPTSASPFAEVALEAPALVAIWWWLSQTPSPRLQRCRLACRVAQGGAIGGCDLQEGGAIGSCDLPENANVDGVWGCLNTHHLLHFFSTFPLNFLLSFSWLWHFRGFGNLCGMKYLFFKKLY